MKKLLKKIMPSSLRKALKGRHRNSWSGNFASWNEALRNSSGYQNENIFEKVKAAALKVQAGEAVYEQDGVLFYEENYSWPLLSGLLFAAANNKGNLSVMDFGGSLGSTYFQHRKVLQLLPSVEWNIIEQNVFVEFGSTTLAHDKLKFYVSPELCIKKNGTPLVLVLSTTLPYLEEPLHVLRSLMELKLPYILIDNTVFNNEAEDRLTIQVVPKKIYDASYPCWFLDYNKILEEVNGYYQVIHEHYNEHVIELDGHPMRFRGLFGKLKNQ